MPVAGAEPQGDEQREEDRQKERGEDQQSRSAACRQDQPHQVHKGGGEQPGDYGPRVVGAERPKAGTSSKFSTAAATVDPRVATMTIL